MSKKYNELLGLIDTWVGEDVHDFKQMSKDVEASLSTATSHEFIEIVTQIGIIPERYDHDSTHEKLYAKMSDCVIALIFSRLGFQTIVLTERADAADLTAKSVFHGYEFVADAKVFRLSRTAKNQKDFKIPSMSHWKKDADYAVVVAPYFQYPNTSSQIYKQILDTGVAINSFEHLLFLLSNNIKETKQVSLRPLFHYPEDVSKKVTAADSKKAKNIFDALDLATCLVAQKKTDELLAFKKKFMTSFVSRRANKEKDYWLNEIVKIQQLTLEDARSALIENKKIHSKIASIEAFIVPPKDKTP